MEAVSAKARDRVRASTGCVPVTRRDTGAATPQRIPPHLDVHPLIGWLDHNVIYVRT